MALSMVDKLSLLLSSSPFLDKIEDELKKAGKSGLAKDLNQLQQDAAIDWAEPDPRYDAAAGPQTAPLDKAYRDRGGITLERINAVLRNAHAALPEGDLKTEMGKLNAQLLLPETQTPAAKPKKMEM